MAFGRIGEVRDVYIPRDFHSQQPKGFAFIEYATPQMASEARDEMDKFLMKGRELEVVYAQEKRKTPNEMRGRVVDGRADRGSRGGGGGRGGEDFQRCVLGCSLPCHVNLIYVHSHYFSYPLYVTDHRHLNATKSVNANARITSDLKMPNAVIKVKILGQSLREDRGGLLWLSIVCLGTLITRRVRHLGFVCLFRRVS